MKQLSISKDNLRGLWYDLIGANKLNINKHPQEDMRNLGINIIDCVPQSIADGWSVLTDYQGDVPSYIYEREINPEYWKHFCDIEIVE